MTGVQRVDSGSEADTIAAGRRLAGGLRAGDVVLLDGPLGAGKTAFARGIAEGLGCDTDPVSSPTFTIIQEYRGGRIRMQHVDLYRLTSPEVDDLGLEELGEGTVLVVEWPERWHSAPPRVVRITIRPQPDGRRSIEIED